MGALDTVVGGVFGLVILIFLFVLAVLWFCLPFAVFGIKDRLDTLIRETKATTEVLHLLGRELERQRPAPEPPAVQLPPATPDADLTLSERIAKERPQ